MNLRWLWFDHFPPELGLTREQKQLVRARASLHRKREPTYRGAQRQYLMSFVPVFLISFALYWWWLRGLIGSRALPGLSPLIAGGLGWLFIHVPIAWALHRSRTPFIRRAIRDIGYEICENCGYWLRGLRDDVAHCPECGEPRQPMTSASDSSSSTSHHT